MASRAVTITVLGAIAGAAVLMYHTHCVVRPQSPSSSLNSSRSNGICSGAAQLLCTLGSALAAGRGAAAAAVAGSSAQTARAGDGSQQHTDFFSWLADEGVDTSGVQLGRNEYGVRGVFATRDIGQRQTVMAIPHRLLLKLPLSENDDFCEQGEALMLELLARPAALAAYLDVLPTPAEVALSPDTYHLPRSYWPLLQSEVAQRFVFNQRMAALQYWQQHQERLQRQGGSLELLRHALYLCSSRTFQFNETHFSLVPLVDMTNHVNGCPTLHSDAPCPSGPEETCFTLRAGAGIAAGSEVCNAYGYLRNDEALLHYGFVQESTELLNIVDLPEASMEALAGAERAVLKPAPFDGSLEELRAERERLRQLLAKLEGGDAKAAQWPADKRHDSDGVILHQLLQWRDVRKASIRAEIARLQQQLEARGHADDSSSSKGGEHTEL